MQIAPFKFGLNSFHVFNFIFIQLSHLSFNLFNLGFPSNFIKKISIKNKIK